MWDENMYTYTYCMQSTLACVRRKYRDALHKF